MKRFLDSLFFAGSWHSRFEGEIAVRPHSVIQHGSPVTMSDIVDTRGMEPDVEGNDLAELLAGGCSRRGRKARVFQCRDFRVLRSAMHRSMIRRD